MINPVYEEKTKIVIRLMKGGFNGDEAAKVVGFKSFDSMRGSLCFDGGVNLRKSIETGTPVEWVRTKNGSKDKLAEINKKLAQLVQLNKRLYAKNEYLSNKLSILNSHLSNVRNSVNGLCEEITKIEEVMNDGTNS